MGMQTFETFVSTSMVEWNAPFLEVLQYQADEWSGWSKLPFYFSAPKIHLTHCLQIEEVADIKLITIVTILGLS